MIFLGAVYYHDKCRILVKIYKMKMHCKTEDNEYFNEVIELYDRC